MPAGSRRSARPPTLCGACSTARRATSTPWIGPRRSPGTSGAITSSSGWSSIGTSTPRRRGRRRVGARPDPSRPERFAAPASLGFEGCPESRRGGGLKGPEGVEGPTAEGGRQPVQQPRHRGRVPHSDQEEGEDHEGEGQCGEDLRGDGRHEALEGVGQRLQEEEEVGPRGTPDRVPVAEDHDGEGDPPGPLDTVGPAPPGLHVQGEGCPAQPHERPPCDRVEVPQADDGDSPSVGGLRPLADAAQDKPGLRLEHVPPDSPDQEKAQVHERVLVEEHRPRPRPAGEDGDGQVGHLGAGQVRDGVPDHVREMLAQEGEDEARGHLVLAECEAAHRHHQARDRPDGHGGGHPRDKEVAGPRRGKGGHGAEEDEPAEGEVDDAVPFREGYAQDPIPHRGRGADDGRREGNDVDGPYLLLWSRACSPPRRRTSSTSRLSMRPPTEESSCITSGSCKLPAEIRAKNREMGRVAGALKLASRTTRIPRNPYPPEMRGKSWWREYVLVRRTKPARPARAPHAAKAARVTRVLGTPRR